MDFLNINETVQSVIRISKGVAREYGNASYAPPHLLYALMHKETGLQGFVESMGKDAEYLREWAEVRIEECPKTSGSGDIQPDPKIHPLFEQADNVRLKWGLLEINPLCLLAAIATPEAGFTADELRSFPIREREIHDLFMSGAGQNKKNGNPEAAFSGDNDPLWAAARGNLEKYCTDKTALAADGKIFPVVCRDRETRMMMEILGRMGKPNVLIKELEAHGSAILFIDEIHTLIDPRSGNSGAAGILKPELAKGNITVIGATTVDEYRKLIEPDHAFNRRFEVLQVEEPDLTSTVNIIESALERYETYHGVGVDTASNDNRISEH